MVELARDEGAHLRWDSPGRFERSWMSPGEPRNSRPRPCTGCFGRWPVEGRGWSSASVRGRCAWPDGWSPFEGDVKDGWRPLPGAPGNVQRLLPTHSGGRSGLDRRTSPWRQRPDTPANWRCTQDSCSGRQPPERHQGEADPTNKRLRSSKTPAPQTNALGRPGSSASSRGPIQGGLGSADAQSRRVCAPPVGPGEVDGGS